MGEKRAYKPRKPGGGRKKLKPEYDAGKNLKEQMDAAVALYDSEMSLQTIGDALRSKSYQSPEAAHHSTVCMNRKWPRRCRIHLRSTEKHKPTKPPYSQPQRRLTFPKPPLPRTYLIRKACTFQVQQKRENQCWSRAAAEIQSDEAVEG